ncbi:MAG: acetylxylan esterase, partial [Verrucomicrobiota bacterium]
MKRQRSYGVLVLVGGVISFLGVLWGVDGREGEPRHLDSAHPYRGPAAAGLTAEAHAAWAEGVKRRVLVSAGLWPMPEKGELNAAVYGKIDRGDYTVEKVRFESLPGHWVTGNLYRPAGAALERARVREGGREEEVEGEGEVEEEGERGAGGFPGVLCPHGHWTAGRFLDQATETRRVERQVNHALASGAERFESGARSPLQARCVQLARMGCVVFHYDMLGTADSMQIPVHKENPLREEMHSLEEGEWGFGSAAATARLQTTFGLQTWNSVRALDFLESLEDVDGERIGVTGASGGGTQTMVLAAIDERVKAAFSAVMPSTAMQGGCTCENGHYLRIGQGNIDLVAAVAPRALGLTSADDWTIDLETEGHPELAALYAALGADAPPSPNQSSNHPPTSGPRPAAPPP